MGLRNLLPDRNVPPRNFFGEKQLRKRIHGVPPLDRFNPLNGFS